MNVTDVPAERKLLLMGATQESAGSRVHESFPVSLCAGATGYRDREQRL